MLDLILILLHDGIVYQFCRFVTYNHQSVVKVLASNSSPQNYNNTVHRTYFVFTDKVFLCILVNQRKDTYFAYINLITFYDKKKILTITLPLYRKFLITKMLKHWSPVIEDVMLNNYCVLEKNN